jgi:two-component system, response regulator
MSEISQNVAVLLIEDTATDAELCIRTLKKQNIANEMVWLKDGAEALAYLFDVDTAPRRVPRLVLLDLHLPRVHGLEVLRRIKSDEPLGPKPSAVPRDNALHDGEAAPGAGKLLGRMQTLK